MDAKHTRHIIGIGSQRFKVGWLEPDEANKYAPSVRELLYETWRQRFVDTGIMSEEDLRLKIDPRSREQRAAQAERIRDISEKGGKYIVAMETSQLGFRHPILSGLVRAETYPSVEHGDYPNISDIESLPEQVGPLSAYLLKIALSDYGDTKLSVYSEEPNPGMNDWLVGELSMEPSGRQPEEKIGSYTMRYIQFIGRVATVGERANQITAAAIDTDPLKTFQILNPR